MKKMERQEHLGVSKNSGKTPKSSILIGFSIIINHLFWCTSIFGNTLWLLFQTGCGAEAAEHKAWFVGHRSSRVDHPLAMHLERHEP